MGMSINLWMRTVHALLQSERFIGNKLISIPLYEENSLMASQRTTASISI